MRRLLVVLLVRRGIRHRAAAPAQFAASASVSVHRQMLLRRQRQEKATKKDFLDQGRGYEEHEEAFNGDGQAFRRRSHHETGRQAEGGEYD
eukprot:CAMPEP_0115247894 /NCGR_PEP_ID=MMETSP0270-20121206/41788_1 /TAXON_ID=71861 /ORGANISM="Scrippsiella trochoidea, Strain CCMP3099" /LENGTH=90 /DNA_ID=CAMNT_0002663175 /DNA_START=303 /DNA_END=575 /DNA_ORIENTATION=-